MDSDVDIPTYDIQHSKKGTPRKSAYTFTHSRRKFFPLERLDCTALMLHTFGAPIFDIPEVELQCGFSPFGRCLFGDVRCGGNLEKVGDNIYAKREAIFPPLDCTGLCLRTFVIHFRYTGSGIRMQY